MSFRYRRISASVTASILWLATLLAGQTATAPTLSERVAEILDTSAARQAFWGIQVVDLETGDSLFSLNSDKLFLPASNAKLYSSALALVRLGPDYRFSTKVVSNAVPGESEVLPGDLVLLGGGDPNLSARIIPYNPKKSFDGDSLSPMRELAQQVARAGIKRIEGDVVGDDTRYVWQRYPAGWSVDDATWGYGAPVSALAFNDNIVKLKVLPGQARQKAHAIFEPDIGYFSLENRLWTAPTRTVPRGLNLRREPASKELVLWGDISYRSRGRTLTIAVDDPALFAASALTTALKEAGIEVSGVSRSRHAAPYEFPSLKRVPEPKSESFPTELAEIRSAPLAETLKILNKESQNLHAEMLLHEVACVQRGVGSFQAGLEEMKAFLKEAGLERREFKLQDASGLSRRNLVSPDATVKLLGYMWRSPQREVFVDSLPVAGEDGTLDWRFSRSAGRGRIRAKTGTLAHVTAISGYATTNDERTVVFSIMTNNYGVQGSYIRRLVDKVCLALLEAPGPAKHAVAPANSLP